VGGPAEKGTAFHTIARRFYLANQHGSVISAANRRPVCPLQCIWRVPLPCFGKLGVYTWSGTPIAVPWLMRDVCVPAFDARRNRALSHRLLQVLCNKSFCGGGARVALPASRNSPAALDDRAAITNASVPGAPRRRRRGFRVKRHSALRKQPARRELTSPNRVCHARRCTHGHLPKAARVLDDPMPRRSRASICQFCLPIKCARIILHFGLYAAGARRQRPA
jgi:hypothetical protein